MNLKVLNVFIEENLYSLILEQARSEHTDTSNICNRIFKEFYKDKLMEASLIKKLTSTVAKVSVSTSFVNIKDFDVGNNFEGFPHDSIKMAQKVIDHIVRFDISEQIYCRRTDAAIDFEPNFIRIERLISQGNNFGINISLYGEPYRYKNPPVFLEKGMNSYSRAYLRSYNDLEMILPQLKETYYLKFQRMLF